MTVPNPFLNLLPADKMPGALRTQRTVTVGSLLRTYPHYGTLTERFLRGKDSRYYSLQFKAEKPMSKGLAFTFGYNYSKETRDQTGRYLFDFVQPGNYVARAPGVCCFASTRFTSQLAFRHSSRSRPLKHRPH